MPLVLLILLSVALFVLTGFGVIAVPLWVCLLPLIPVAVAGVIAFAGFLVVAIASSVAVTRR